MKICDLTQFYSPLSGGVKRYVHEKADYIRNRTSDEHLLIIPGGKTERIAGERSCVYSIRSPLISRTARYRALLDLRSVGEILEREQPDIIESSDPYQVGWKAIAFGNSARIPVVAFYHSHFPEAYLRGASKLLGHRAGKSLMSAAQRYVRKMYNRFAATLVPSEPLAQILQDWGVRNTRLVPLGVNTDDFAPAPDDSAQTRQGLGIAPKSTLLLYVGRLAPEKNTTALFEAFDLLAKRRPSEYELVVIGDGPQRQQLRRLEAETQSVKRIQYCTDPLDLARYYRAADLFVHPGTQETFGLVALESQACGTPVIGIRGSRLDGIILHDQEGWAAQNTAAALADAIEQFSGRDLKALGRAAAHRASAEYGWPGVFERLLCIYREVCANYRRADP
ncbi:MAG TPA: glycosyltransferase [Chthoniobacterales bacterium]|nr:glycosyltransferase [Chthoniobacterales bacterium]